LVRSLAVFTYVPAVDISEMVCLENVMEELELGPNGGADTVTMAWMKDPVKTHDACAGRWQGSCTAWTTSTTTSTGSRRSSRRCKVRGLPSAALELRITTDAVGADKYLLFDFPGQVELYTHEQSVHHILQKLQKLGYKVRTAL